MSEAVSVDPSRRLILLVDDDIHLLALLSKMLQMAHYDVRIATSSAMALSWAVCTRFSDATTCAWRFSASSSWLLHSWCDSRSRSSERRCCD